VSTLLTSAELRHIRKCVVAQPDPEPARREILRKIELAIGAAEQAVRQQGAARGERFPAKLDIAEAKLYSEHGERLMLAATEYRVDEHTHATLACLLVGMVTALCQVTDVRREALCNELVANVLFAALKAAHKDGRNAANISE